MKILVVAIQVKPEAIDAFIRATIQNASSSAVEPGIARFDFAASVDDPARFVLVEAYRSEAAILAHKQTAHYKAWRSEVESMMAEPRIGTWYTMVHPQDEA